MIWSGWVLWHIKHCGLFNVKSSLYIYIKHIWFGRVGFYGISSIVGYLMSNHLYIRILNIYDLLVHFSFLSRGFILWIELPCPENLANTNTWYTETLDSCFDLIKSHQQCIPWYMYIYIYMHLYPCPWSIYIYIYIYIYTHIHLYPCPWSYNDYVDAHFYPLGKTWPWRWLSSVKSTDVTCKTYSG